jgi:hypothetical protein
VARSPFFSAISFITWISRSRSASIFFSRAFSCSSSRSFFKSAVSMDPKCRRQLQIVCSLIPCRLAISPTGKGSIIRPPG